MGALLTTLYVLAAAGLALYGGLGLVTLLLYLRHRRDRPDRPSSAANGLPPVTVQLPLYNERYVVDRLIRATAALDYPRDRLQIQIIDDSTDETTAVATQLANYYQQDGLDISLQHRNGRGGYKAGALAAATQMATGQFIAIFDADFLPPPDFLQRTIPHFLDEPRLGLIQARWGHLNPADSALTAAQAIALDKHFALEQLVRHRADLFPKFNGTAGIWRRGCIDDAGGWQTDTVCEDLCLSTRAALRGWRFRFLDDLVAPAELPASIAAYKSQQARWATGSFQCLRKFGAAILRSPTHSWLARLYALLAMSAYLTQPLLLILLLVQLPLLWLDLAPPGWLILFGLAGVWQPLLFLLSQQILYPDWLRRLRHLPALLLIAIGTAPGNSRAIWRALRRRAAPFERTPKLGQNGRYLTTAYRPGRDPIIFAELGLALYALLGLGLAVWRGQSGPLFLLASCAAGLGYVAWQSWREQNGR